MIVYEFPKEGIIRELKSFPVMHFCVIEWINRYELFFFLLARLIKVERPLYGVEVFVGETARFEIEISEPDVHPIWKLKGETLTPSPVRLLLYF